MMMEFGDDFWLVESSAWDVNTEDKASGRSFK